MDWLTFIDHLIGHLAWPLVVAALVVFLSLRHRVAFDTLLHRVRKARAGPFEAELDEAKAEADAAGLPPAPTKPPPDTEVLQRPESNDPEVWFGYFIKLAEQDPLGAVHGSYRFLNSYLAHAAARLDPRAPGIHDPISPRTRAAEVGLLTWDHERVIDSLRDVVKTAHQWDEEEVSRQQAREFVFLVARLWAAVEERLRTLLETRRRQGADDPGRLGGR
jgi:hypothetical protein